MGWIRLPERPDGSRGWRAWWYPGKRPAPPEPARRRLWTDWLCHGLLALDLAYLGLRRVQSLRSGYALFADPESARSKAYLASLAGTSQAAQWLALAWKLILYAVIPLAWYFGTRRGPDRRAALGLVTDWAAGVRGSLVGAAAFFPLLMVNAVVTLAFGFGPGSTAYARASDAHLTVLLALAMALVAGVAEEVLYRGVLQRWLGWWGQAVVFAFGHFYDGSPAHVVFAAGFGLWLGWLRRRGASLWYLAGAHAAYDALGFVVRALAHPG